ncbi:MAG TPA: hypothetical protein VFP25_04380 [Nitrososphaeraceae archaeon]|nr:hypothetical protein [Nitrososphaeraceae archaeon]
MLISIVGIIFSNLELPSADAAKKSFKSKSKKSKSDFKKSKSKKSKSDFKKSKSKASKSDFKKSKSKASKSDFKKSKSKASKSDFKKYDKKIKKEKKFKPSSISQGSTLPSFKPINIKDLDKDKLKDLDKDKLKDLDKDKLKDLDKDKLDKLPGISQLPYFPECGQQGTCIDIGGGIDIDDGIDIDGDVDIDWDNGWHDIDWDDIDVDIDDDIDVDIDDDDIDITVRDDDDDEDDDEDITYIYNYGYPESSYSEPYAYEDGIFPIQEEISPQQSYVESEVQRIVNEGSFKLHLVESGKPFTPSNNSGYVLLGANQGTNNELEISNGLNGQLIILTGADDLRPIKVSSIGNIKLDLNEAILGKNDALILAYLDQSTSWIQIASKFV